VDQLTKFLATSRGRVFAGAWGVVLLAGIGVLVMNLSPGSGASAIKPIHVRPHVAPKTTPIAGKPGAPQIASKIPPALAVELIDHEVAIVEIYNPGEPHEPIIADQEAHKEAKAGAQRAGVGFVSVDVRNDAEMTLVSTLVTASSDPFLFILDRTGTVLFQRAGYLDGDTIAQAATNALIGAQAADPVPAGTSDGIAGPYDGYWKAVADQVLCDTEVALKQVPPTTGTVAGLRRNTKGLIAVQSNTLARLGAIRAVGPDAPKYAQMLAAYGAMQNGYVSALGALEHKPPLARAYSAALTRAVQYENAHNVLRTQLGLTCFTSQK
jgi:hypothetical protein